MASILRQANITVPAGNQVTNTTTKTLFTDALALSPNSYIGSNIGVTYNIKAFGYISSAAATPGNLTIGIEMNGVVLTTGVLTLITSLSSKGIVILATVIICNTGSTGAVSCQGFISGDGLSSVGMVNTGLTATGQKTVNTLTGGSLSLSAQFSVADVANIITLSMLTIEELQ